jgi:predicted nucleic acid-binding protein
VRAEGGAAPQPWILDVSVLTAVARADTGVTRLLLILDGRGQPLVIPILALAAASQDARSEDADRALRGLGNLENVLTAPLRDADQAARLTAIAAKTDLDLGDAHVAAVAGASGCPVLTLDLTKWRQHGRDLDPPLQFIEIDDPPENGS